MIHLGDITKINGAEIPPVDVITGGSPFEEKVSRLWALVMKGADDDIDI